MKFTLPSFEKNKFQRDTLKVPHFTGFSQI